MEFKNTNDSFSEKSNKNVYRNKCPTREIVIEDLQQQFDKQLDNIALINDFMSLFGQKKEIHSDLTDLRNKTKELKNVLATVRDGINIFRTVQVPKTKLLISNMREQNLRILQRIEDMDSTTEMSSNTTKISTSANDNHNNVPALTVLPTPKTQSVLARLKTITPKMYQSPFKVRANPQKLLQLSKHFEGCIKSEKFVAASKYQKGRDTLDDVSMFLQNVIIKCFLDKYSLQYRDRENILPNLMPRWKQYRSQMELCPDEMFIIEDDIANLIGRSVDNKMRRLIGILRHMRIIQEMRNGSVKCYIWKGIK